MENIEVYVIELEALPVNIYAFECASDAIASQIEKESGFCRRKGTNIFDSAIPTPLLFKYFFSSRGLTDLVSEIREEPEYLSEFFLDDEVLLDILSSHVLIPNIIP